MLLGRFKEIYTYPTRHGDRSSRSPSPSYSQRHPASLQERLLSLRKELESLESDISERSQTSGAPTERDAEILMRGLVEIRTRLIGLGDGARDAQRKPLTRAVEAAKVAPSSILTKPESQETMEMKDTRPGDADTLSRLDKRLDELESLIGSSNALLDEVRKFSIC